MPEVTNELMYEVLKGLQEGQNKILSRIESVEEITGRIDTRLKIVEAHMTGFMSSAKYLETEIDQLRGRVEALESRINNPTQ
ncbi:MAG: hypothetical protein H6954_05180 [Chromatiaceae bacterium]|nr:hypothetical protein [Chromatiaceae bacterium]